MAITNCGFSDKDTLYKFGPTLMVEVGFDPTFHPANNPTVKLPGTLWGGLVDTGAIECCIDSDLAQDLALPIVDRKPVSGVGGSIEVNYHLAQIYTPDLDHIVYGAFAGVHLNAGGQPHRVLIGRSSSTSLK